MNEIWKEIPGYEGYFEVSNLGNFRSKDRKVPYRNGQMRNYPGKPLKTELTRDGYTRITLMKDAIKKRYMCHRLVALAFIPNPNNLEQVNHKDGVRNNNCVDNLEWCTNTENQRHAYNVLGKTMKGKTNSKAVYCKELEKIFPSMRSAIEFLGNHACNEGIKKAIKAGRPYHGYNFIFIESSTTIPSGSTEQTTGSGNGKGPYKINPEFIKEIQNL